MYDTHHFSTFIEAKLSRGTVEKLSGEHNFHTTVVIDDLTGKSDGSIPAGFTQDQLFLVCVGAAPLQTVPHASGTHVQCSADRSLSRWTRASSTARTVARARPMKTTSPSAGWLCFCTQGSFLCTFASSDEKAACSFVAAQAGCGRLFTAVPADTRVRGASVTSVSITV